MANSYLADFVDVWPNTKRTSQYHYVLALIGQIHTVANLPPRKIAAVGHVDSIRAGLQGMCIVNPATGAPGIVGIADMAVTPLFTMAHEFGHCIQYAVKRTILLTNSMDAVEVYEDLFGAIQTSDEYKKLTAEQFGNEVSLVAVGATLAGPEIETLKRKLEHIRYLLDRDEMFARAYSQYVTIKSGSDALQADLSQHLNYREDDPYHQWQEHSFSAIYEAFDRLFLRIGWAK